MRGQKRTFDKTVSPVTLYYSFSPTHGTLSLKEYAFNPENGLKESVGKSDNIKPDGMKCTYLQETFYYASLQAKSTEYVRLGDVVKVYEETGEPGKNNLVFTGTANKAKEDGIFKNYGMSPRIKVYFITEEGQCACIDFPATSLDGWFAFKKDNEDKAELDFVIEGVNEIEYEITPNPTQPKLKAKKHGFVPTFAHFESQLTAAQIMDVQTALLVFCPAWGESRVSSVAVSQDGEAPKSQDLPF